MTEQLVTDLITGAALAILFSNTRNVGIVCVAILTFLFPFPMLIIVLFGVGTYHFFLLFSLPDTQVKQFAHIASVGCTCSLYRNFF